MLGENKISTNNFNFPLSVNQIPQLKEQVKGYSRLIKSLPILELEALKIEMADISPKEASDLAVRINKGERVISTATSRVIIVTALKALNMKLISVKQMATLHILDAAIRDFITHATSFLYHEFLENGKIQRQINALTISHHQNLIPEPTIQLHYTDNAIPKGITPDQIPERLRLMRLPVLKRFFALTDHEWTRFCTLMNKNVSSEQQFHLIHTSTFGCLSNLIAKVQEVIKLCHTIEIPQKMENGHIFVTNVTAVPSFSMFQAVLKVKAETLGRKPVKLLPTYYLLSPEDYARTKKDEGIPFALYFPEANPRVRYSRDNPRFKAKIDGWGHEGPFAALIHDFYHALREMAMTENVAKARFYLAEIAKKHKYDRINSDSDTISNILVDGELIFSYPENKDTIFAQLNHNQKFGELFNKLEDSLHKDLKVAFLTDMVINKERWKHEFNLGRDDLLEPEQELYDILMRIFNDFTPDLELVEKILELNVSCTLSNRMKNGELTLAHAAAKGHVLIIEKLLREGADADEKNDKHDRALYQAIHHGKKEAVKLLLEYKAAVNEAFKCGKTPLIQACNEGDLDIVNLLIEHGAAVNMKEERTGITPLGQAASKGHVKIMRVLLSKGAHINAKNKDGDTALHLAIYFNKVKAMKMLLRWKDILIDEPNVSGDTPLMDACYKENIEVIKLLLNHGASINSKNSKTKQSPFQIVKSKGNAEIIELFSKYSLIE